MIKCSHTVKMDFVEKYAVKVPNAIIVSGVTDRDKDKEVFEFLEQHGTIRRVLAVDDDSSAFHKSQIVEFESGAAVEILAPKLPYLLQSTDNPDVSYRIRALTDVYTKTVGGSVTEAYISNLKGLAKLSGKDFEEVLREALSTIGNTIEAAETAERNPENDAADQTCPVVGSTQLGASPSVLTELPHPPEPIQGTFQRPMRPNLTPQMLSPTDLNPPEVQKVVVEHVVKSVEKTSHAHSTLRLRAFSGKMPRPYSEADYETWRSHVDLLMEDASLSELGKTRKILESLLAPASDVIRPLGPEATPADYLKLLDSAFGTVEDGEELFVRFMNTLQDHGEKPSAYLLRLQVAVNHTVRRGGLEPHEVNKQLLKQFYRGCWDDNLLTELQLELKHKEPPTYAELLLLLRTAENRQEVKNTRMKKHFSATKPKAVSHEQTVTETNADVRQAQSDSLEELKKQVADLKSQLAAVVKPKKQATLKTVRTRKPENKKPDHAKPENSPPPSRPSTRPKPWYCFRCGEDGHIVATCESEPNPALVVAKRKELRVRRQIWDRQNDQLSLN